FSGGYAETKSIKGGVNFPWYQSGLSFYDQFDKTPVAGRKRATRWGYYGMTHSGPVSLLGEVAAGTDEGEALPGFATGPKKNLLAWFAEVDYHPVRYLNFRARYDHLVTDRAYDQTLRDAATHDR